MTVTAEPTPNHGDLVVIDPRLPRFGQLVTATGLLGGILLREPVFIYGVAFVLLIPVITRWRYDPYRLLWIYFARRITDPTDRRDPAPPHRFAKLLGAIGTTVASILLVVGFPSAGLAIAGVIAIAAGLAALTGICIGCRMYRHVSYLRRLKVV